MHAAVEAVHALQPDAVVIGVPAAASSTCQRLRRYVNDIVCVTMPDPFYAVSAWYEDFSQTTDAEVHELLSSTV
jgi:predicted phosphoribosyltransferase